MRNRFRSRYLYWRFLLVALFLTSIGNLLLLSSDTALADSLSPSEASLTQKHMDEGVSSFQRGDFEQAALNWAEAAKLYEREKKFSQQTNALTHLAQAYQAVGQYKEAFKNLESALVLSEKSGDRTQTALVLGALGNLYVATGPPDIALKYLNEALSIARGLQNSGLSAVILNNLGNLLAAQKKYIEAVAVYTESASFANIDGNAPLATRALTNATMSLLQNGQHKEAKAQLDKALDQTRHLDTTYEKAQVLINIGLAYQSLRSHLSDSNDAFSLLAYETFNEAGAIAESIGQRRMASYAWGYLGNLYEEEQRYQEALQLTRRAAFAAQQANAPESLYRWQWQTGRLLKKLGTIDETIAAYRRAVHTLQSIRAELAVSYGAPQTSFRESVGSLYFELVDLLFQRAASLQREPARPYLIEARESIELFKVAELRDYFRDDCVDTALSKVTKLEVVAQTAVVVYPILLPDRTELLVSLPTGLKRFSIPVGAKKMTQEVRQFRRTLEKRTTRQYLPHAQKLYDWLIRPFEADLASSQIDTLVFVPDGALRTIPMSALHDGKQFLIDKYAIGITPGLNLTDPRPINRKEMKVLAVGVTEAVQGFPALPNVSAELKELRDLFGSTTLVDQEFTATNLEKKLKSEKFTIVHIASHGQFGSDTDRTFLLTFNEKLSMNRLDQLVGVFKYSDDPLELLTLSACDTAAGDDRAALGLAGIAIKAGARSALASLWNINDEASVGLVADFYRELQAGLSSRAIALQRAQMKMLANPRYEHPGFWSPFLMINNWL